MSETGKRPFAVFDIDGTLIRWQLYHAVADSLAKDGFITADEHQAIRQARMQWKNRTHQTSFQAYELAVINAFDAAALRMPKDAFVAAVRKVFDEYKDQTYTYTRDLIRDLREQNYLLFAISASQIEIIELLARYYEFDDWGGSTYEYTDGIHTGKKYILKGSEKPKYLEELIEKHGASKQHSIGVGDSDGDIAMLSAVENPIAFNPNKLLFNHAKAQKWKVVIERKNMVYELEPDSGTYKLVA